MSGLVSAIRDELQNKEFRENYVAENVRRGLAYQITALREARGWSRAELARRAGKPQSNVSRWEDPTYGKFSTSTLIEIAAIFDVALLTRFVGFGELLSLRPARAAALSYEKELEWLAHERPQEIARKGSAAAAAFFGNPKQRVNLVLSASPESEAEQTTRRVGAIAVDDIELGESDDDTDPAERR